MNINKISAGALASLMIVSNIACAAEPETLKEESVDIVDSVELEGVTEEMKDDNDKEVIEDDNDKEVIETKVEDNNDKEIATEVKESKVKKAVKESDKESTVDKVFTLWEEETISVPGKYVDSGEFVGEIKTGSGILTIDGEYPDLESHEDFAIEIYDANGKRIDKKAYESYNKYGKLAYRVVLENDGVYKIKFVNGWENNIKFKFVIGRVTGGNSVNQGHSRIEVEDNGTQSKATETSVGSIYYKGTIDEDDLDIYKIVVNEDTKVKVNVKCTLNLSDNSVSKNVMVLTPDGKKSYATYTKDEYLLEMVLKKGTNYIYIQDKDCYVKDYELRVTKLNGVVSPRVNTIADNKEYISGYTEIGNKVYIKIGTRDYQRAKVGSTGYFKLNTGKIKAGTKVRVFAKDVNGKNSSVVNTVCEDKTAPKMVVVNKMDTKDDHISGKAEPHVTVYCYQDDDHTSQTVFKTSTVADCDGNFTFDEIDLSKVDLRRSRYLYFYAKDAAGNTAPICSARVNEYIANPKVNKFSNINVTLSGTAPKGTTVYVKANGKNYKGTVDAKGKFSIKIPKQAYKSILEVYAKNGRDVSDTVKVKVGYAPKKPAVNKVTTKSTKITGKSSKNATITVKIGSKTYTGKTNSKGAFSIKIPKQKRGTQIKVQAKFASNGYKSYTTTIKVK